MGLRSRGAPTSELRVQYKTFTEHDVVQKLALPGVQLAVKVV